jgi:hypothetical protein
MGGLGGGVVVLVVPLEEPLNEGRDPGLGRDCASAASGANKFNVAKRTVTEKMCIVE